MRVFILAKYYTFTQRAKNNYLTRRDSRHDSFDVGLGWCFWL